MAIRVVRNEAGNCVNFVGSTNPTYWNACLSATVDLEDSTRINVINDVRTVVEGSPVYEFYKVSYLEFRDRDDNPFADAQECADYITAEANVSGQTGAFVLAHTDAFTFQREATDTSILVSNGDHYGVNTIQAVGQADGTISITELNGDVIYSRLLVANVTVISGGTTFTFQGLSDAVNALNALFQVQPVGAGSYGGVGTTPTTESTGTVAVEGEDMSLVSGDPVRNSNPDTLQYDEGFFSDQTIDAVGEYFEFTQTAAWQGTETFGLYPTASGDAATALANSTGFADMMNLAVRVNPSASYPATAIKQVGWGSSMEAAGTTWRVGIDQDGFLYASYYSGTAWVMVLRSAAADVQEFKLMGQLTKNGTFDGMDSLIVGDAAEDSNGDSISVVYRYIESPDGSFHYPLFASQLDAAAIDTVNGGSGQSSTQIFSDATESQTWYAPITGYSSNQSAAPTDPDIHWLEISTGDDADFAPTAFTINDLTVDEGDTLNYQLGAQGANYTTTISGAPSGASVSNHVLTGSAPQVADNNQVNPSDTYTITVTRTNNFGTASTTFDLTVNNLTAPSTPVSGFTWDNTSPTLVDADTMRDGSVVTFDETVDAPKRLILEQSWVEANVLPALQESGDAIWVGVKDGAGSLIDGVAASDFDAYIKWEWAGESSHTAVIGADTTSSVTINSLTDAFYDYAFEADDEGNLHAIGCNIGDLQNQPGVEQGGQFSRVASTTGTEPFTLSMVTVGTQMTLATSGLSEIVIPQPAHWIQVQHGQNHGFEFKQTGAAAFGSMPTLQAGYTYRFLVADVIWADQSTSTGLSTNDILKFTADGSTEYTTGITRSGAVASEFAYVEFAVPSNVPPLSFYNDHSGIGGASGIAISGSTYVVPVTGITLEGPAANQTGTNVMDQGDHGWISLNEQLSAGERLVMDNAFWTDFLAELNESTNMFAIGLKGDNWTNTKEVNSTGAASTGEFFKGDTYIVGSVSGGNYIYFRMYSNGVASNQMLVNTTALHSTVCAFLEITSSGDNIRAGFGRNGDLSVAQGDESTVAYADWSSYKGQTGDQGYGITSKDVVISFWTYSGGAIDGADIDWTGLSEVSVPTPAATLTTPWTKALDFSGGSERTQQVTNDSNRCPLMMGGTNNNTSQPSITGYTSNDTNSRPWATSVVFNAHIYNDNQHVWNLGEGAGTTDDNIYLRRDANRNLWFGWGRTGELNECYVGSIASNTASAWWGVYIAHNGTRLGSGHLAHQIAACFDIRMVNLQTGATGSNLSTSGNWNSGSFGARMNRQFTGDMTLGGRGANRSFRGKIAAMVVTTLRRNVAMPTDAEISMMVRDPQQWMTDYKVGNAFRLPWQGTDAGFNWAKNDGASSYSTQVWLMGDGANDAYAQIRNNVHPATQSYTPMNMISMVSNDIETVSINGLT